MFTHTARKRDATYVRVPLAQMQDLIYRTLEPVAVKWFKSFSKDQLIMRSVGVCELVDLDLITDVSAHAYVSSKRAQCTSSCARATPLLCYSLGVEDDHFNTCTSHPLRRSCTTPSASLRDFA